MTESKSVGAWDRGGNKRRITKEYEESFRDDEYIYIYIDYDGGGDVTDICICHYLSNCTL